MALKTNYKDDVLDLTQNANRKYEEIENQDGSISFNDVTVYDEVGDTFGAADANSITRALTDTTRNISFQFGIDTNGDYGYIKDGETEVTPFKSRHTETYKPTVRANNNDMGLYHKKRYVDTTAVPNSNTGTYTASSRGAALDMGATNTYRYVNTNSVPNSNSGTYPNNTGVTANGTYDMGATNTYRYVKVNVPLTADGSTQMMEHSTATSISATIGDYYIISATGNDSWRNNLSGCTLIASTEYSHVNFAYAALVKATATTITFQNAYGGGAIHLAR